MKILLVNPNTKGGIGLNQFLKAPPLSLMYLSSAVKPLGHQVDIVDMSYREKDIDKDLVRKIDWADLVGVTSFTPAIQNAMEIIRLAKNMGKLTILGGYHASLLPETTRNREIDVTVQGEGEFTFHELVEKLDTANLQWDHMWMKDVQGISYMREGELITNNPRPMVPDLDLLPFPDRTLTKRNKYKYFGATIDSLESARGCVGQCNFCCVRPHWGRRWRCKSPERVIKEIATMNQNRRWFTFQDSEFTLNMKRCDKIFSYIKRFGYDQRWYSAQGRLDDVVRNPDVIARMADAGFKMLFVGIESIYQKSLDLIGKHITLDQIRTGVKILHDHGITIFGAILIGNLGEDYKMVEKTISFARELDIDIMQFTALTPLPATPLYDQAKANGWIEKQDWRYYNFCDPVMHTPDLTTKEIRELVIKAYRDFYLQSGFLQRKGKEFVTNKKFRWFFRMAPGFLSQSGNIYRFISELQDRGSKDGKVSPSTPGLTSTSVPAATSDLVEVPSKEMGTVPSSSE